MTICCSDCRGGWCSLCLDHHGDAPCPVAAEVEALEAEHRARFAVLEGANDAS